MSTGPTNFAEVFARLAATQQHEETASLGGVAVRMVRVGRRRRPLGQPSAF